MVEYKYFTQNIIFIFYFFHDYKLLAQISKIPQTFVEFKRTNFQQYLRV